MSKRSRDACLMRTCSRARQLAATTKYKYVVMHWALIAMQHARPQLHMHVMRVTGRHVMSCHAIEPLHTSHMARAECTSPQHGANQRCHVPRSGFYHTGHWTEPSLHSQTLLKEPHFYKWARLNHETYSALHAACQCPYPAILIANS
jgi:hypothetical protein